MHSVSAHYSSHKPRKESKKTITIENEDDWVKYGIPQPPLVPSKREKKKNLTGASQIPTRVELTRLEQIKNDFSERRKKAIEKCKKMLGFDPNKEYALDPSTNLSTIVCPFSKQLQTHTIPLDDALAADFINAKKYCYKSSQIDKIGQDFTHRTYKNYCIAEMNKGPIFFCYDVHFKDTHKSFQNGTYSTDNHNITLYALISGKQYIHLYRYDAKSPCPHLGLETNLKFGREDAHEHWYSLMYALVYAGTGEKKHFGHNDRRRPGKECNNLDDATIYFENMMKIEDVKALFKENMTAGDFLDVIQKSKKRKSQQKSETKFMIGGKEDV